MPPSPASVCSSPHREFSRPDDYSNLVSTLDVPDFEEDQPMPQVFREISSNLLGRDSFVSSFIKSSYN